MKSLTYVELDISFCSLTYGVAPCTASLSSSPPTGDHKCFNTKKTCQDRENYTESVVTLRFVQPTQYAPRDIDAISSIESVAFTPATISLGKDLGTRASLSVTFKDHLWPDTGLGFDKYRTERPYDPMKQGTFWGRFRARQPYLRGQPIRLIRGFLGQSLAEMETHHYVVDSFNYNAADGTFTITAKDVLKLADDDRSQAPLLSQGFLNANITETDTSLLLQPNGIGNSEYPTSGYVAIAGKEIVAFERDPTAGADANAKSILHFDGSDGDVGPGSDTGATPKTWTYAGLVERDSSRKKFGSTSVYLPASGGYVQSSDHADFTPPGNFTIEGWFQWETLSTAHTLFTHYTNSTNRYALNVSSAGALSFVVINAGVTTVTMTSANGVVSADGLFHHIAVVKNGTNWRIYVDGVSVATTTDSDTIPNFTSLFLIGCDYTLLAAACLKGWVDEFRLSHVARWTSDFTPPVAPYLSSSDLMSIIRGQLGTEAISHEANDRVQIVLRYLAQDPADIIRDLLVNYAGVPDTYIPIDTWRTETANYLSRLFSADIAEPTGVNKLISEIIEDGALSLWWDDVSQLIRLRVLRSIPTTAELFDKTNYMQNTFSTREQPNDRVSQVWRYFAKRNPLEGQDDPDNYRSAALNADLQAETDYKSPVIVKIFSRWTPFGGRAIADRANQLYLARFRDPPRRFVFSVFKNDALVIPELGQGYRIVGMGMQDDQGLPQDAPIQITRLSYDASQYTIEAEELFIGEAVDLTNRVITIDTNTMNIDLQALHNTLYPAVTDDDVYNGVNLKCYIEEGVKVGSTDEQVAAFIVGNWPVGFPITLIVDGKIQGCGGKGGSWTGGVGANGHKGGTALYTRFPIDLEVANGEIWAGGGGGGLGSWTFLVSPSVSRRAGGGGGGGAGINAGPGGIGTIHTIIEDGDTSVVQGGPGANGTETTGGAGGSSDDPPYSTTYNGGAGGGPGLAGSPGTSGGVNARGLGGAAGNSIDGVSYVTITTGPGDRRGLEVN